MNTKIVKKNSKIKLPPLWEKTMNCRYWISSI